MTVLLPQQAAVPGLFSGAGGAESVEGSLLPRLPASSSLSSLSFSAAGPAPRPQPPPGRVHWDLRAPLSFQPLLTLLPLPQEALPLAQPLHQAAEQHRLPLAHQSGFGEQPGLGAEGGGQWI